MTSLSRIVISPAQHHIHHSYLPQHCNKNYGEMFAFWDWMFGTIYMHISGDFHADGWLRAAQVWA